MTWDEVAGRIGMGFLSLWNRKRALFPPLIAATALGWALHYLLGPTLVTLHLALLPTVLTLMLAFIGLIAIEHIEATGDFSLVPTVVTQTLVAVSLVLGSLLYLSGMLFRVFPPPPLPLLFALLFAMEVAPLVTLLVLIPPLVGYIPRIRPKWRELRGRYPFWGIYLGFISAFLTLCIPVAIPEMLMISGALFRIVLMGGVLIVLSVLLAVFPREGPTKAVGVFMVLFGILLWFGASGGLTLGSVLAILGGAHAYTWKPNRAHTRTAEQKPQGGGSSGSMGGVGKR